MSGRPKPSESRAALAEDLLTRHLQVSFPEHEPMPDWVPRRAWLPKNASRRAHQRLRTVAVVGAGASISVLPIAPVLASELEHDIGLGREEEYQAELERLERVYGLPRDQFETRLVALCRNPDDQRRVRDQLSERYGIRHPTLFVYEILAHLLKHRYLDAIISFNFDELLDQSLDDELGRNEYARVVSERDCLGLELDPDRPDYRPLYIKMHGTASEPESLRFTRESYYWTPKPILKAVEELFDTDNLSLMNLGCRLAGFDFHHLLRMARELTIYHLDPQPLSKQVQKDIKRYRSGASVDVRRCGPKQAKRQRPKDDFLPTVVEKVVMELRSASYGLGKQLPWRGVDRHRVVSGLLDGNQPSNPKHYPEYLRQRTVLEVALAAARNRGVLSSSSLDGERCGQYYELYVQMARRAQVVPMNWPGVCAAGGLIESRFAPDSWYARKEVCRKRTTPAPTRRDPKTEHRLPAVDPRRMAKFVLGQVDASRWPDGQKWHKEARAAEQLFVRTLTHLGRDHELEIHSMDDRICSKVFVTPRVLATYTTFKTWTSVMIARERDYDELLLVAETGEWLLDDYQLDRLTRLGKGKIKLLVAFNDRIPELERKYGKTLVPRLIPWWRHNRHMRLLCLRDVPVRAVYYARRQRTSMITPVALRHGADLRRLRLSFDNLWTEAGDYEKQLFAGRRS